MRLPWSLVRLHSRCLFAFLVLGLLVIILHFSTKPWNGKYLGFFYKNFFGVHKGKLNNGVCPYITDESSLGPITADTDSLRGIAELESILGPQLLNGGHFKPKGCRSQQLVALIVPYRDRKIHLKRFLWHMHPFLQRQNVEYRILVIEQDDSTEFNRGLLMNIGFKEALKLGQYNCFIFHDVDLLPLDDRIVYKCSDMPVHLSAAVDTMNFTLMYEQLFGGACAMSKAMMEDVNGFSNLYFGWGGEDDDMSYRIRSHAMNIVRFRQDIARYTMMRHGKADQPDRSELFSSSKSRIHMDGLNSLTYECLDMKELPLYTWVLVSVNRAELELALNIVH